MPSYDYLIIGGGMTADAALHGTREADSEGSVGVVGAEPHRPVTRDALKGRLPEGEVT